VKIRGYGVEIAEAENVLRDYAGIDDAVVVARENESGEARLVAYFISPNQPGPSVSALRWSKVSTRSSGATRSCEPSLSRLTDSQSKSSSQLLRSTSLLWICEILLLDGARG
jgi:hypothetical protein